MPSINETSRQNITTLGQLIRTLPEGRYTTADPLLMNSSIGQHTRHILEFYVCLFDQMDQGWVNYEARERNLQIETDTTRALQVIDWIANRLMQCEHDVPLFLHTDALAMESQRIGTSFFRELAYCLEHAIHHMAIIRIAVDYHHPLLNMQEHFGVAPSTIQHRLSCVQ